LGSLDTIVTAAWVGLILILAVTFMSEGVPLPAPQPIAQPDNVTPGIAPSPTIQRIFPATPIVNTKDVYVRYQCNDRITSEHPIVLYDDCPVLSDPYHSFYHGGR
jgi:hypothetical protein